MNAAELPPWTTANQHYLMAAVEVLRLELGRHQRAETEDSEQPAQQAHLAAAQQAVAAARAELSEPAALDTVIAQLGLSEFEGRVLLMCAAVELDAEFGALVASLQNGAVLPSFSLALAALPDSHWSALTLNAPLRYWRLLELTSSPLLTRSPLKIDEQVLHFLAGVRQLDDRLREVVEPVSMEDDLVPSQQAVASQIVSACLRQQPNAELPLIQFRGEITADRMTIAALACGQLGLQLYSVPANAIPAAAREITELARLWSREAALNSYALYLDATELDSGDKPRLLAINAFIQATQGLLIVSTTRAELPIQRIKVVFEIQKPTPAEQLILWKNTLDSVSTQLNGQLEKLVAQFNLSTKTIHEVSSEILPHEPPAEHKPDQSAEGLGTRLWGACCRHTRPQISSLGEYIEPVAGWDDLVLPEAQKAVLQELVVQVRHRAKVYGDWGFASKSARGLGISALFAGESGTGKTMASEVLAKELELDLYRIDLSQVVNKYIGETEKNLKRIFDAAEEGGAILLFDEADALFGKRSDVKDSHDRYSNIEVSYLLQRMEAYRGLAILTTNMKSVLDKAFLRRLRFVVQFPYPDALLRAEIWKRVFPHYTPTENLDPEKLARLNIPGGNIRNIALNAAFMAAHEAKPVHMAHIARAAHTEYTKIERTLSNNEVGKW
ncbi:ATP-binding protein [Hymenobacter sp. HD11105]